jgi:hypothetical protein
VPAKQGTYRYKVDSSDEQGAKSTTSTTKYEDKGGTPTETNQLVSMRAEQGDIDSDISWRSDGVYVLKSVFAFGGSRGECDWSPDIKQVALPMAKGLTWESSGSCTVTGFGAPVTVSRKVTGKVVDLRRVRVAGRVVDVWVIEGTEHLEFAGNAVDASGTTFFSPKYGVPIYDTATSSGRGAGSVTREIQNLDPE